MESSDFFTIIFFFSGVLSTFLGVYTLYLNPKARLNKAFLALCISLSIWAWGFSFGVSAPTQALSLIWRRLSVAGWGTFFSILLHFSLILTGKKGLLGQWWLYPLLYFPSVVTLYMYGISPTAEANYKLIHSVNGWINVPDSGFNAFFNYYYFIFSILSVGLIWSWGRKASHPKDRKKALLIQFWITGTLILTTVTDIVAVTFLKIPLPQLAPFLCTMSMTFVYCAIHRYGLMKAEETVTTEVIILNDSTRGNIISYLGFALFASSFINLAAFFLFKRAENLASVILTSIAIFLLGLIIFFVKRSPIAENKKDFVYVVAGVLAIPLFTLRFIQTCSITVWVFPVMFIIFAMVLNNRLILAALGVSILSTQLLFWLIAPKAAIDVDAEDYFLRIFFFLVFLWLASYVNKLYIRKLQENATQMQQQKLVSKISADLFAVNQNNLEQKINQALAECGRFFELDRVWIYSQAREQSPAALPFSWSLHKETDRETTMKNNPIYLPISAKGEFLALAGLDTLDSPQKWRDDQLELLKVIANILGDALAKVQAEKDIQQLAYFDHLTNLPNRVLLWDKVAQAIRQANRMPHMLAVIFLDLDSLKTVNDTLGHEGGDELITQVGHKLSACTAQKGTIGRFSGDEFLILLDYVAGYEQVIAVAEDIMALFQEPAVLRGQEFFVTASAGIAFYPFDGPDTQTLIKNADIAMYKAKEKGKNQYALCSSQLKEEVRHKMTLTNSLFRALDRNELSVHYQPQVRLPNAEIIGLEALLRWNHPDLGMISPALFIPIAEQSGMINPIGEWVLKTACQQSVMWRDKGYPPFRISVNISAHQLRNPAITRQIDNILRETGLEPQAVELEITEGSAIGEDHHIVRVLQDLKQLGIKISIDDFGKEYSSLTRLKDLPIDRLKMDMNFVHSIEADEKNRAIVKAIIHLAENLGLEIIAEGVETQNQVEFLSSNRCFGAQGYYFHRPMPPEEIEKIFISTVPSDLTC